MNNTVSLEKVKENFGNEKAMNVFKENLRKSKVSAIRLVNDQGVSFSTYFLVVPLIKKYNLVEYLTMRNKIALGICNEILDKKKSSFLVKDTKNLVLTLKWIVNSAAYDDGQDDKYDKVIDVCIAKLLNDFNDEVALKPAVDLAFVRNKKKAFNHDLVWAIFKKNDAKSLEMIAEYLKSPNKEDNDFSNELLSNAINNGLSINPKNKYDSYSKWLKENSPYINFTGESYNISSKPNFFNVNMESKYQCKPVKEIKSHAVEVIAEAEKFNLDEFKKLDKASKIKLSKMSNQIHDNDINLWDRWKRASIKQQLNFVNKVLEVHHD